MTRRYWLVKQEPSAYAWSTFVADGSTAWTGVRNFQARNNLRAMQPGDLALYYHSNEGREIIGLAEVQKTAYPDPTATAGDWSAVDLKPVMPLRNPVALDTLKSDPVTRTMPLIQQSRLSVMPLTPEQFQRVMELGGTRPPARTR
ncbi:MAG: EVE domain-containing protein [Verrucomicrobiota bacterium]